MNTKNTKFAFLYYKILTQQHRKIWQFICPLCVKFIKLLYPIRVTQRTDRGSIVFAVCTKTLILCGISLCYSLRIPVCDRPMARDRHATTFTLPAVWCSLIHTNITTNNCHKPKCKCYIFHQNPTRHKIIYTY